jgi:glycosyltransferase involved in cell wall biosynthesis
MQKRQTLMQELEGAAAQAPLSILMVAPQPFFRARGTPFSVLHRIRALTSLGHKVTLLTYPFGEDVAMAGLRILRVRRPPLVRDVRIGPSAAKLVLDLPLFLATRSQLRQGGYDVVHSHEEAAFFCARLARRFGLPHIYDMHSSMPQQLTNFGRFDLAPVRKVFQYLEEQTLDSASGVISICSDLARIVAVRCPDTPHAMIENTADDRLAFPVAANHLPFLPAAQGKRVVLYTGTFESYQGLDLLIAALPQLRKVHRDVHLVLVGGRDDEVRQLRVRLAANGQSDWVSLTGTLHPSLMPGFLAMAEILVSPRSGGTNTPLKLYGYLRSGVPLVATRIHSHTQCLDDSIAQLVEPSAAGIADGVTRLLDDTGKARALAEAAVAHATSRWSDQSYIDKVQELYQRVCGDL